MALRPVTFKLPESEVEDLDAEAEEQGKSRSEYIRQVIRGRHIEEQLEEQVLTKQDKREYEERIEELKEERDEYRQSATLKERHIQTMETTIDRTVEEAVESLREEYERQIEELQDEKEMLSQAVASLADDTASTEDVEDARRTITEMIDRRATGLHEGQRTQAEMVEDLFLHEIDQNTEEVRHARSPATKLADWLRALPSRLSDAVRRESDDQDGHAAET